MIKIAIDAMGGENTPEAVLDAVSELVGTMEDTCFILVGRKDILKPVAGVEVVDAPEVIRANESPSSAFRSKKNSSIAIGIDLQRKGEVDAFVSAGNTGAFVTFCTLGLGRLKNVKRTGLATFFPTKNGKCLVIDVGANTDCKPEHLLQYGIMGSIYAEKVMNISSPRIGILSIGEEEIKGNSVMKKARGLLASADINFVGNIEGHTVLRDVCDVLVCDGFVGNSLLKFGEGMIEFFVELLKEGMRNSLRTKLGGLLVSNILHTIAKKTGYSEIGGAIILGVRGVDIVCHGRSDKEAIKNAIRLARECSLCNITGIIEREMGEREKDGGVRRNRGSKK